MLNTRNSSTFSNLFVFDRSKFHGSVPFLLKLGCRCKMECVLNETEKHLIKSSEMDVEEKLHIADDHKLGNLKDYCLNIYLRECLIKKLKSSATYANFSAEMKAELESVIPTTSKPIDLGKFISPNGKGNVTLIIGDKKLRVSKEYLAVHSPVFAAMFFGKFAEKEKEEVEIKDAIYEELIDLIKLIYPQSYEITDRMVPHILELADRYDMECARNVTEKYLIQSKGFDDAEKLLMAEQYRLSSQGLKRHCYKTVRIDSDLKSRLKSSPEFANFSRETKAILAFVVWRPDSEDEDDQEKDVSNVSADYDDGDDHSLY